MVGAIPGRQLAWLAAALGLALGCAGSTALHVAELPGAQLEELKRFYVRQRSGDALEIHLGVQQQIRELGLEAEAGDAEPPDGFDAEIHYSDRYAMDGVRYCIQLTLYVRDLRTGYIVATGRSYRQSPFMKTPAGHARLILRELFGEPEASP